MRDRLYAIPEARGNAAVVLIKDNKEYAIVGTKEYIRELAVANGLWMWHIPAEAANGFRRWDYTLPAKTAYNQM